MPASGELTSPQAGLVLAADRRYSTTNPFSLMP